MTDLTRSRPLRTPPVLEQWREYHLLRNGDEVYAGNHFVFDLWGGPNISNEELYMEVLPEAARLAGATVLSQSFHSFGEGAGFTGVLVLSESHISFHSWPEIGLITFDIYMCGDAKPMVALEHIKEHFAPERIEVLQIRRGVFR